jgi:type II secretion system protein N
MNRFSFTLSEGTRTALRRYLGYPLFFLFAFLTSAYLSFPYERVREVIERQVAVAMPGSELEIVSLEPSWVSGVELTGVSLRIPSETEGERPMSVTLPRVWARVGILSYLFGTTSVSYEVEIDGGGIIEGSFDDESDDEHSRSHLIAHLENVDLRRIGPLRTATRLPVTGIVTGDIDVTLDEDSESTVGEIALDIADASLGDGRAGISIPGMPGAITVERLALGNITLRAEVEHGTARITQLLANGEDAELRGSGTVRLVSPIRNCALDVLLRINILPTYRERNDRTRGIFGLADMSGEVRPYRAADGAFQIRLQGTLGGRVTAVAAGSATMPD